jgi:ABC-type antimicrobial peptide transport system permease subunit
MILYTGLLFLIIQYVFTLFSYIFLYDVFPPYYCDSLFNCYLTYIDVSFKYDSGMGGFSNSSYDIGYDLKMKLIKWVFDNM